jgi:glycosyltransferase involved in cell wall biosynthesis
MSSRPVTDASTTPGVPDAEEAVPVSVVIPTRNRRDLLLRTLGSVLAQRRVELSVVVVDDAGTDGSAEAVHRLADARVRVVRHERCRGVSQARNTGIERVETAWVAFVDDDDLWSPDKLRTQLDALRRHPVAQWACTGAAHIDSRCRILSRAEPPEDPNVAEQLLARNVIPGGGSGVLASTALAREVGGFDTALSNLADWDFYTRLSLRTPMAAVPGPLVGYHVHLDGMAHNIEPSKREFAYLADKYAAERQARGIRLDVEQWLWYLAGLAQNRGRRWTAKQLHLQAAVHRRPLSLRPFAAILLPQRLRIGRRTGPVQELPADWLAAALAWLAEYQSDPDAATAKGTVGRFPHPGHD